MAETETTNRDDVAPFSMVLANPSSPFRAFYPERMADESALLLAAGHHPVLAQGAVKAVHDMGGLASDIYVADLAMNRGIVGAVSRTSKWQRFTAVTVYDPKAVQEMVATREFPYDRDSRQLAAFLIFNTAVVTEQSKAIINQTLANWSTR